MAAFLAIGLLLVACSGDDDASPTTSGPEPTTPDDGSSNSPVVVDGGRPAVDPAQVLGLRLTEGAPIADPATAIARVDGTPLTAEEVAAIVARLPEWVVPDDDRQSFNRPDDLAAAAPRRRHDRHPVPARGGRPGGRATRRRCRSRWSGSSRRASSTSPRS